MSNIYTFSQDNIINNIDLNNMRGGLGYDNVYDMIKQTIYIDDNKKMSSSYYNPDERKKTCKTSEQPKLRCDSGKLLKYLIRMELNNYKKAKDNAKKLNKDAPNRDEYLRIVKPYKSSQSSQSTQVTQSVDSKLFDILPPLPSKSLRDCVNEDTQKTARENETITALNRRKIEEMKQCKESNKKTELENKEIIKRNKQIEKSNKENEEKNKKIIKENEKSSKTSESNNTKYQINIQYLQSYFNKIRENIKKLVDLLEGCPFLVNIDQDSFSKGLMTVIATETLKDILNTPEDKMTDKQKEGRKQMQQIIDQVNIKQQEQKQIETATLKAKIFTGIKKPFKWIYKKMQSDNPYIVGAAAALGIAAAAVLIFFGAMWHCTPWGAAVTLGTVLTLGAVWGIKNRYITKKFGKNEVTKVKFIKILSMFALNEKKLDRNNGKSSIIPDSDYPYNPYNEDSVLKTLEDDLINYLRANRPGLTQQDCNDPNKQDLCIIDVNELCITSVEKDCPPEGEFGLIDGEKGSSEQLKIYEKKRDKKKKLTKGILQRFGDLFENVAPLAGDDTLKNINLGELDLNRLDPEETHEPDGDIDNENSEQPA